MNTSSKIRQFSEQIVDEVHSMALELEGSQGHTNEDTALAGYMTQVLEGNGIVSNVSVTPFGETEGRSRCKISAYSISEESARIDAFLAHFVDEQESNLPVSDLRKLTGQAAKFVKYAFDAQFDRFSEEQEVLDAAKLIHAAKQNCDRVRVFILTNTLSKEKEVAELDFDGITVSFEIYDIERVFRLSQAATSRSDIQIDLQGYFGRPLACLEMSPRPKEYETFLAVFSGEFLYSLYEEYGQQLFEFNVRSFLQARGKVNKGIRETLRTDPERFMAYNNGLVVTADHLEVGTYHGETSIKKIIGMQIVNGAQTTASIHRAKKIDKIDLSSVSVAVKITQVHPDKLDEFVPLISKFANTQNNVQAADLSANHPIHIEMERLSSVVWTPGERSRWFYERTRGAYDVELAKEATTPAQKRRYLAHTPRNQRLTKTDLARYQMAWMGRPYTVSFGAQKCFTTFMSEIDEIFAVDWSPDERFYKDAVSKAILYRTIERVVRQEQFPAYRANISAYLMAVIGSLTKGVFDFEAIWSMQEIPEELIEHLREWSHKIDRVIRESASGRNVTEWCKKSDCWEIIRVSAESFPPVDLNAYIVLDDEQIEEEFDGEVEENDWKTREQIDECMKLNAEEWAKISYWGQTSKRLRQIEYKVAFTLSEYASAGWKREPSVKQAAHGYRAIQFAKKDGVL